jgi:hypothetical protein
MGGRGKGSAGSQITVGSAKAGSEIQAKAVNTNSDNASTGVIIFMMVVLLRQATSHASILPHFENGRCVEAEGHVVVARKLRRKEVLAFFAKLAPCLVGMEACGSVQGRRRSMAATRCSTMSANTGCGF